MFYISLQLAMLTEILFSIILFAVELCVIMPKISIATISTLSHALIKSGRTSIESDINRKLPDFPYKDSKKPF